MQFDQLIKHLEHSLKQPLPGVKAHTRLFPPTRSEFPPINFSAVKIGAVLAMLFSQNGQTRLTFILRKKYNGVHSGQISFRPCVPTRWRSCGRSRAGSGLWPRGAGSHTCRVLAGALSVPSSSAREWRLSGSFSAPQRGVGNFSV